MCNSPGQSISAPASAAQALAAARAGLDWLASADAARLTGSERADCLRELAALESVHLAATARVVTAFDTAGDCGADGQFSARAWLRWQARMTRPAAVATVAWARRLAAHPAVADALGAGQVSPSYARRICDWSDQLPAEAQPGADDILVEAAAAGADVSDLAVLFEEIRARTARTDGDGGADPFGQRWLRLDTYFRGNGQLTGDLTASAAAGLQAVLDSLGSKAGPEDDRTRAQRDHDALEEACQLLIASGCLPAREGQPVQLQLHMTLSQLLDQEEADPALAAWIAATGAAAPPGADCDATVVPIVTGIVDDEVAAELTSRYLGAASEGISAGHDGDWYGCRADNTDETGKRAGRAFRQLAIADAIALLSGPGKLTAYLRGRMPTPAGSVSLPLDIGAATPTIPAHIRRAVTSRDQHCRFPGCDRPPAVCHVHHLRPRAGGGETSVTNCCLLCTFHHLIAVHRWGWNLILQPDGTTTAASPDGRRVLHSHAPPTAA